MKLNAQEADSIDHFDEWWETASIRDALSVPPERGCRWWSGYSTTIFRRYREETRQRFPREKALYEYVRLTHRA